jgi:predicted ATPase
MSIQKIRVRNFRGFKSACIELKPLTVLLGPNSAGKSVFGHALAAMSYAQWLRAGSNQATLTPEHAKAAEEWPIDLGSRKDLVTHGVEDRVYIDALTRDGWVYFGFGWGVGLPEDLRLTYIRYPVGLGHSSTAPTSQKVVSEVPESHSGVGEAMAVDFEAERGGLELIRKNEVDWETGDAKSVKVGLSGFLLETVKYQSGTEVVISGRASADIKQLLQSLTYLRATRVRPARSYGKGEGSPQRIGYAGEWTPSILHSPGSDTIRYAVPIDIPNTVKQAASVIDTPWKIQNGTLAAATSFWLQHLRIATNVEAIDCTGLPGRIETHFTVSPSGTPHDITEVGFGLSQVLPVLVGGLIQPENSLYMVDLPEAHLHPRPQAALADFFCSLVLSKRSAMVETHSEMFFHRLRLWAALSKELADSIAVYFVDAPTSGNACSEPRRVGLNFEDELKWPKGFLQEAWESESQIKAARAARKPATK